MKKVVAIGELLIDFVPQQKGCALDEVTHTSHTVLSSAVVFTYATTA